MDNIEWKCTYECDACDGGDYGPVYEAELGNLTLVLSRSVDSDIHAWTWHAMAYRVVVQESLPKLVTVVSTDCYRTRLEAESELFGHLAMREWEGVAP